EYLEKSSIAITPVLPTKEPEYSLSMRDEHLSTILETELDELIKSSIENLFPIPIEYEVTSDNERCSDGKFQNLFEPSFNNEEFISNKIDPHYFNVESNLIESLPNRDTLFDSSPKFDYLKEFSSKRMPTSIINEECIKREHEEYISLMEKLLTINSFPRPLENFHTNTIIETLPTSPIPIEDNDSLREEIDIFTRTDDLMPPGLRATTMTRIGIVIFLKNYLAMFPFLFPKMSHLTLIITMIRHFLVLLQNHQMLRFSLIFSLIHEN
nr:hypothetical protein [Tanacetum cinerariifolium]